MFDQLLSPLLSQLRANPRLRWGLWTIAAILWLYGILLLRDIMQESADQYESALGRVAALQAKGAENAWLERSEQARLLRVELEARLWRAATPGLAQAGFQDSLNLALLQAGVGRPAITLAASGVGEKEAVDAASAGMPEGARPIKAKLEFDFDPKTFLALAKQLAENPQKVAFESLSIRLEPIPRAEATLVAYFRK